MNKSDWKDTAELIGIAAIVASLIFVGFQLRLEGRVARATLSQSQLISRAELAIGMSENAIAIAKVNGGENLSASDESALGFLVDAWFRRALIGSNASRQIRGDDGSTTRAIFSIMLYENPGLRRIWEQQRKREAELMDKISPDSQFIHEYAEMVRADLATLDELSS